MDKSLKRSNTSDIAGLDFKISRQDEDQDISSQSCSFSSNSACINHDEYHQIVFEMEMDMGIIEGNPKIPSEKKNPAKRAKIEARRNEKEEQKRQLWRYICALRNSGGGVILMKMSGSTENAAYLNKFHKVFDEEFKKVLFHDEEWSDVFKFHCRESGKILTIFVQGSSKIVTCLTHTKQPIPKGIETVPITRLSNHFPFKSPRKPDVKSKWHPTDFKSPYQEEESQNIQFKAYHKLDSLRKVKNKLEEDVRFYSSAFTKLEQGGSIFFGIEEKPETDNTNPTVIGLTCKLNNEQEKNDLKHYCAKLIEEQMIWLSSNDIGTIVILPPKRIRKYYQIFIHNVFGGPETSHVLEVAVGHFEGLVFHSKEGPVAWRVQHDEIAMFDMQSWFTFMNKEFANLDSDRNTKDLLRRFERLAINSASLDPPKLHQLKGSITDISETIFRMGSKMNLTPTPLVNHLKSNTRVENAITILREHNCFKKSRSVSIFDEKFSSIIDEEQHPIPNLCQNCRIICEVLVLGQNSLPLFLSFCDVYKEHTNCLKNCQRHNNKIAKLLLSKLKVYNKGLIGLLSYAVTINTDVKLQLDAAIGQKEIYPDEYRIPGRRIMDVLFAFIKIAASIPSPIQSLVNDTYLRNILCEDQFRILHEDFHNKNRLLINGFPGTGKTELCNRIIDKLHRNGFQSHEILFVTEHIPPCDAHGGFTKCLTLTRYELQEKWKGNPTLFKSIKHCFVDDAQLILYTNTNDWFEIIDTLMQHKVGKIWIFYGSHAYSKKYNVHSVEQIVSGKDFEKRKLKVIIRNTINIADFAKSYSPDEEFEEAVMNIPHKVTGEKVQVIYRDLRSETARCKVFREILVDCLAKYSEKHIAVLFNSVKAIPNELKCDANEFRTCVDNGLKYRSTIIPTFITLEGTRRLKIVNASRNKAKDAVVVDSIRRYTSLDRLVVIVIGCDCRKDGLQFTAYTRPLGKLIVVHPL